MRLNLNISEKPQFDYGKVVEYLLESYKVKLLGEEKLNNKDCYILEAESKDGGVKMKIWVDKEFWYPIRTEVTFESILTIVEYKNISFNTHLSDDLFEFKPPEGVKVVEKEFKLPEKLTIDEAQKRVNFTIIIPKYTANYKFDYAMVFNDFVQLYYKKGDEVMGNA
ncbi:hypothetical protein DRP05_00435 [Archaeoglobales archaeon]|nr:MAG: hypothetical protein DRP05_00435 [Archaeoglobales archaeon]